MSPPRAPAAHYNILSPEEVQLQFRLASRGSRTLALLVDLVILAALFALLLLLGWLLLPSLSRTGGGVLLGLFLVVFFLLRNFYFVFFELRWSGQTPGKKLLGLRVVAREGGPLTPQMVFARNLTREFELFLPVLALSNPARLFPGAPALAAAFAGLWTLALSFLPWLNARRARLGDLTAGTLVIDSPKTTLLADLAQAPSQPGQFTFTPAQLSIYGIRELQTLEDILRTHDERHTPEVLDAVAHKITRKLKWPAHALPPYPEPFLRHFYTAQRAHLELKLRLGARKESKDF